MIKQFIGDTKEQAAYWANGWQEDNPDMTMVSVKYQPTYSNGHRVERYIIEYEDPSVKLDKPLREDALEWAKNK